MRPQLVLIVDIERVHLSGTLSRYNHNINLLMQLTACRGDFTFPFGATPDPAGSRLRLFSFQTALKSGHSRPSFCRKCCDAPLRRVVASLPVETLQLFHVGTIRTWKEKRVIRGVEGCGEGAEEGLVWESKG